MTNRHLVQLKAILAKLETLQRDLLRSKTHKHDVAVEDMERAKTALLTILNRVAR